MSALGLMWLFGFFPGIIIGALVRTKLEISAEQEIAFVVVAWLCGPLAWGVFFLLGIWIAVGIMSTGLREWYRILKVPK